MVVGKRRAAHESAEPGNTLVGGLGIEGKRNLLLCHHAHRHDAQTKGYYD